MKKRVLSLFMAFVLCLTLLPAPALAVSDTAPARDTALQSADVAVNNTYANGKDTVVQNGIAMQSAENVVEVTIGNATTPYTDIKDAFTAAQETWSPVTVKLLQNVTLNGTDVYGAGISVGGFSSITLDLNGKTVSQQELSSFSSVYDSVFCVLGTLTVMDSVGGGGIVQPNAGPAVTAFDNGGGLSGTLVIEGGTIETTSTDNANNPPNCAVYVQGGSVEITGGTVKGSKIGVEIDSGKLTVTGSPAFHGEDSNALQVKGGTVKLSGGTYTTNETDNHSIWNVSGKAADLLADGYRYEDGDGNASTCSDDGKGVKGKTIVKIAPPSSVTYYDPIRQEENTCTEYTEITDASSELAAGWYVVTGTVKINGDVTVTGDVSIILRDGASLTVNGGLLLAPSTKLQLYGQKDQTGQMAIINQNDYAMKLSGESGDATFFVYGGKLQVSGNPYAIQSTGENSIDVVMQKIPGWKWRAGDGTTPGYEDTFGFRNQVSFTVEPCTVHDWEYHYSEIDENSHHLICKLCGAGGGSEKHSASTWTSTEDGGQHTGYCVCGKEMETTNHSFKLTSNADGLTHSSKCTLCDYADTAENHSYTGTTESGYASCACGARLAAECGNVQYASLQAAVNAAATGGGTVTLAQDVVENVTVTDGTVTVDLNGKTWKADDSGDRIPLTVVTGSSVTLKNGTIIQGIRTNGDSGIQIRGGSVTVEGDAVVIGSNKDNSVGLPPSPAIELESGDLTLATGATLVYGLKVPADTHLSDYLPAGTAFGLRSYDETNKTWTVDNGLLANADTQNEYAVHDMALVVVEHTKHEFKPVNGDYVCECGAICAHTTLDENYKCTLCGLQYVAECNGTYYESLLGALNVSGNNNGAPAKVLTNITFGMILLSGEKSYVLDLNGKTVAATDEYYSIDVTSGASFQLKGEGTLVGTINVRGEETKLLLTDEWKGTITNISVLNAQFEMSSGIVSGVLSVQDCTTEQAKNIKITGGTFAKFGNTFSSGFDKTGCATLQDLVADGYAIKKTEDGSYLTADERAKFEILEEVTVVPCKHDFASGTCPNCGAACPHTKYDENGVCIACKKQVMTMKVGDELFNDFDEAKMAAKGTTTPIVLLDDLVLSYNGIGSNEGHIIDFNGKTIKAADAANAARDLIVSSRTSVTLTDNSEAKNGGLESVLYIGGMCTITGGTYTKLTFGENGKATLSDCTVTKAINAYSGKTVASFLKSGYAVYLVNENDNSSTVVNAYVQELPGLTGGVELGNGVWEGYHYEIREHKHSFGEKQTDGLYHCDCGVSCAHTSVPESGENAGLCPDCGTQFAAKVTDKDKNVTYYADGLNDRGTMEHGMFHALKNAPDGSTVKALTSGTYKVTITGGRTLTLDMNGTTNDGGSITLGVLEGSDDDNKNTLILTGSGTLVSHSSGWFSTINVFPDNTLTVDKYWNGDLGQVKVYLAHKGSAPARAQLSGGTFQSIGPQSLDAASTTAGSYLAAGYAFRYTDGAQAWVPYDTELKTESSAKNTLENVGVVKCPHDAFETGRCVYCNYVCPHETINPSTGTCTVCGFEYAAKIGEVYYVTLLEAFDAAKDGETITLLRNTNGEQEVLVTGGKTLMLNLNGFNLDSAYLLAGSNTISGTEADAGTLKITGKGELFASGGQENGKLVAQSYSTLDLSEWSGSTVRMIEVDANAKVVLPTSSAPTIQHLLLTGEATDELLTWSPRAPQYAPTFGVIAWAGNGESTVKLGDLLKNVPEGCAFYAYSETGDYYVPVEYVTAVIDNWYWIVNVTLMNCGHSDKLDHNAVCDYCNAELLAKHESFDEDGDANTTYIMLSEGVAKIAECVQDKNGVRQTLTLMRDVGVLENNQVTLTNESVPLTLTMGAYADAYAENAACNLTITLDAIKVTVTDGKYGTLKANVNSTLNITGGEFNVVELYGGDGSFTGGTFTQKLIDRTNKALIEYLPIGYAYQKDGAIYSGNFTNVSAVTVVTHEDTPDETGKCACGRQFGASMVVDGETTTHWYKTLVDAADAANQTDGTKTIKLYQDYAGENDPVIKNNPVTLDLNGKVIGLRRLQVYGTTLTIQGSGTMQDVSAHEDQATGKESTLILNSYGITVSGTVAVFDASTLKIGGGNYGELYVGSENATAILSGGSFGKITKLFFAPKNFLASDYAYRNTREFGKGDWVTRAELEAGGLLTNVTVELVPVEVRILNEEKVYTTVFGDVDGKNGAINLALTPGLSEGAPFKEDLKLQLYVDGKLVDEKATSGITNPLYFNAARMFANLSIGTYTDCHVDVTYRGYTTSTETFTVEVLPSEAALRASLMAEQDEETGYVSVAGGSCEYGTPLLVNAMLLGTGERLENTRRIAAHGASAQPAEDYFVVLDEAGNEISTRVVRDPMRAQTDGSGRVGYPASLDLTQPLSAGERTLTVKYVSGSGTDTGDASIELKVTITQKDISGSVGCEKAGEEPTYTGEPLTMRFNVTDTATGAQLVEGRDFEVVYDGDHANVGTVNVSIQPKTSGNYIFGEISQTFTIHNATLTDIVVEADALTYNGEAQSAVVKASATAVKDQPTTFTYSTELNGTYTQTVPSFTDAGTYKVYYKVSAPNHSEASGSFDVTIDRKNISGAKITLESSLTYSGAEQTQTVTKVETSDGLTVTTYDVTDNTGTNAGSYEMAVIGKGNFVGSAKQTWSIARKPLTDPTIEIEGGNVYTGSALMPMVTVKDGATVISENEYSVRYDHNTNAGTAEVTLVDKEGGNYAVSGSSTFEIGKTDASCTAPSANVLTYNGTEQTLVTAGTVNGGTMVYSLEENGEYVESFPVGKNVGTYTVWYKVVGDGNHNDTAAQSVEVMIGKAAVTVAAKDKKAYVGETAPALPTEPIEDTDYTVSGLFGEDTLVGSVTLAYADAPDMSKVGETTIKISGTLANDNYAITYVDGKLTISTRPSSGGGGAVTPPTTTETETTTDSDGTTTKTETKSDGSTVETVTKPDGSTTTTETKTETKPDGSTTTTETKSETNADGSKSETKSETKTAADGSKTETKFETKTEADGTKSETETKRETKPDGSTTTTETKSETKSDGSKTETKSETKTDANGSKTETKSETKMEADGTKSETKTETKTDANGVTSGTETTKTTAPDGSAGTTTTTTENGNTKTEAEAKISEKAVEDAKQSGEAVKIPTEVKAGENSNSAPTVKVELPKNAGETKIEIPVSDVNSGTVAVIVHEDGTEEIVKSSTTTENGLQLKVDGSATIKVIDNSKDFIDTRNHWSREEVNYVVARELFNGIGNNLFGVGQPMTRGMVNTVLARLAGVDTTPKNGQKWYEVGTEWAKANDITDGSNPEASVTREQLAAMLYRFAGSPAVNGELSFADADQISGYAKDALLWAVQNGILNGIGNNLVAPTAGAERAQVAAMMARYLKKVG